MDQLDSPDGAHSVLELLESQHRPEARLDVAVILLNDIVEILARADRDGPQLSILGPKLANGPMGGLVSVEIPCQLSSPYVGRIERLVALENAVREHEHFAHDGGHSDDFRLASRKKTGIEGSDHKIVLYCRERWEVQSFPEARIAYFSDARSPAERS